MTIKAIRLASLLLGLSIMGCGGSGANAPEPNAGDDANRADTAADSADGGQPEETASVDSGSESGAQSSGNGGAAGNRESGLTIQVADWEQTQKLVAEHSGKVVVVDVWSTYCTPCIREFPYLVDLHEKYPDDVVCMAVNTNYEGLADEPPEWFREEVREFAVEHKATFRHVILSVEAEQFYDQIELGGPPAVFVYDRQGQLVKRFDNSDLSEGEFTYEKDVFPLVEQLIAKK